MKFKSIQKKLQHFSIVLLGLAILSMGLMAFTTGHLLTKTAKEQLNSIISNNLKIKGNLEILNLKTRLPSLLEENSFSSIEEMFQSVLKNDSDFIYVNYIDTENKQWIDINTKEKTIKLNIHPSTFKTDSLKKFSIIETDSTPIFQFTKKIFDSDDELLGNIILQVSTKNMTKIIKINGKELQKNNTNLSSLGIIIFSILLLIIGYLFSKRYAKSFIKPLSELERHAKHIASGNYNIPVNIESNDEVGNLALELEKMRKTIFENNEKMRLMINDSENKIKEIDKANKIAEITSNFQNNEVTKINEYLKELANGNMDFIYKVEENNQIKNIVQSFTKLSNNLNISIDKLSNLIYKIKNMGINVENSSNNIYSKYEILTSKFSEIEIRTENATEVVKDVHSAFNMITGAVNTISDNINDVNNETKLMTDNMKEVTTSLDQIIGIIHIMSENFNKVLNISTNAVNEADVASKNISNLEKSANEISNVVDIIKKIADQTNLLALNATIEAASAGEAGKGFSVVANEIKELARKSRKGAENIFSQVSQMQQITKISVSSIKNITNTIFEIKSSSKNVTTNINDLQKSSNMINERISDSNNGIIRIASSISSLTESTNEVSNSAISKSKNVDEMKNDMQSVLYSVNSGVENINESNSEIKNLTEITQLLKSLLQEFKIKEKH